MSLEEVYDRGVKTFKLIAGFSLIIRYVDLNKGHPAMTVRFVLKH